MSDLIQSNDEEDELSDSYKIEKHLENLREAFNDQRVGTAIIYTERVHLIDKTHADVEEWFLIFDEDQPILRLEHAFWKVEKGDGEWDDWVWELDGDVFKIDVTKEPIPWEMLEKETGFTSNEVIRSMADKFSDNFMDLFYKGEEGIPDPTVVFDTFLRKELATYCD